jgi:hypothetical protein
MSHPSLGSKSKPRKTPEEAACFCWFLPQLNLEDLDCNFLRSPNHFILLMWHGTQKTATSAGISKKLKYQSFHLYFACLPTKQQVYEL